MIEFDKNPSESLLCSFIADIDRRWLEIEHDPCILHNGYPVYDLPRSALEKIIGIEFHRLCRLKEKIKTLAYSH